MNSSDTHKDCANTDDLDTLLDDALEDFSKPTPQSRNEELPTTSSSHEENTSAWANEFINQATQNFETALKCIIEQQEATDGKGSKEDKKVDLGELSSEFAKFAEVAATAASTSETCKNADFAKCLQETMKQISKNTEEAQAIPTAEELEGMFQQLGFGDKNKLGGNEEAGDFFPLMQNMLENILSKDVLYYPMKEIVSQYPDWLADNRGKLTKDDFDRYNKQYEVMKEVVSKYENEKDNDPPEVKAQIFEAILVLMQKLQDYGQPPQDLIGNQQQMVTFDKDGNPQLPDLSSFFGSVGFPSFGTTSNEGESSVEQSSQQNTTENTTSSETEDSCAMM